MKIPHHCEEDRCKEFFSLFARFEYAMKAARFRRRENGRIALLWNDLADSVREKITNSSNEALQKAIEYILSQPPKKQDLVNDELKWVESPANRGDNIHDLFVYICRVRNNLFHGGKFHGKYLSDPERSLELMECSSVILNACIELNHELNEAFSQ